MATTQDKNLTYETVDELLARAKTISDAGKVQRLLDAEQAAEKPRKTAIDGLEQRLGELRDTDEPEQPEQQEDPAGARLIDREDAAPLLGEPGTYPVGQTAATAGPIGDGPGKRVQLGGTIIEGGRPIAHTLHGALSAVPGGPPDPTILPPGYEAGGAQSGSTGPATGGAPAATPKAPTP